MLKYSLFILFILLSSILPNGTSWADSDAISLTKEEQNWLAQKHTVRVRVGDHPPWQINTPEPQGMVVDYLTIIGEKIGINFKFIPDHEPWIVGFKDIAGEHRRFDLSPTAKRTPERLKYLAMSDDYLYSPWVVFTRKDVFDIFNLEDLRGRKVSVERGYVMEKLLRENMPEIELVTRESTEEALIALSTKQADAYVGNLIVTSFIVQRSGITNIKVACPTPFGLHSQTMATRKEWAPLISIINKGLKSIPPEEKAKIQSKYVAIRFEHGIRQFDVFKWVAGVASALLVIIALIGLWNRRLNKEIRERLKAEDALKDSEARFRSLSDAAFEGIIISEKGNILDANNAIGNMFGYSASELVGTNARELVSPEYRDKVQEYILSGYEKPYEVYGLKKDGTTFPVEVHAKMFSYQERQVRVTAIRDLTEQKKIEEEIKTLKGIVPICMHCKEIRDDQGYWNQLEKYISEHSDVQFSHGICEKCLKKHYPEVTDQS